MRGAHTCSTARALARVRPARPVLAQLPPAAGVDVDTRYWWSPVVGRPARPSRRGRLASPRRHPRPPRRPRWAFCRVNSTQAARFYTVLPGPGSGLVRQPRDPLGASRPQPPRPPANTCTGRQVRRAAVAVAYGAPDQVSRPSLPHHKLLSSVPSLGPNQPSACSPTPQAGAGGRPPAASTNPRRLQRWRPWPFHTA